LELVLAGYRNLTLLHNTCNRGLAASLNIGISEASRLGYKWLLTLDDDTVVASDMCRQLLDNWAILSQSFPMGILAMSWGHLSGPTSRPKGLWNEKRMVITSGSLFAMDTYDRVGQFRNEFVIDSVDSDFCLRVRRQGLRVIQIASPGFTQRLGLPRIVRWGPFRFRVQEHSPLRSYYRVRNST